MRALQITVVMALLLCCGLAPAPPEKEEPDNVKKKE